LYRYRILTLNYPFQYLAEIDEMKRHCMDFFAKRSAQKRSAAITKEDVEECFQELREKRQRMLSDQEEEEKEAAWTQVSQSLLDLEE